VPTSARFPTPGLLALALLAGCPWIDDDELFDRQDVDHDGFVGEDDCGEGDPDAHPGADELCDGHDDDCDGEIDEPDALDARTWFTDADGDGRGVDAPTTVACDQPELYAPVTGDCDDADPLAWTGAAEVCNDGSDNDCDGTVNQCELVGEHLLPASASGELYGSASEDYAGFAIAVADVDGDGAGDVVIGSPGADGYAGAVIVAGGEDLAPMARVGATAGATFGMSVDAGPAQVAAGGPAYDGIACVWSSLSFSGEADLCATGSGSIAFGTDVALLMDTDTTRKLAVSAPWDSTFGASSGSVYVFDQETTSGAVPASSASLVVAGYEGMNLGQDVDGCDVDADGAEELLIGSPYGYYESSVLFVETDLTGSVSIGSATFGGVYASPGAATGYRSVCGDFDGDGATDDVAVGSPELPNGDSTYGDVTVYAVTWGEFHVRDQAYGQIVWPAATSVGRTLAAADFDADGADDLLVGGMLTTTGEGAAALYTSATGYQAVPTATFRGDAASVGLGRALAAGDVNGDGVPDALIGDPILDTYTGAVFLVAGQGL
jgi:hypothetical protein